MPPVPSRALLAAGLALACALGAPTAQARLICTLIADAPSGNLLAQKGQCDERVTSASTFKIALSLMGFDAGILQDEHTPTLPFQPGYPDWAGDAWRQPTDPARWMQYSVYWYSQQIAHRLGQERFAAYTRAFDYGNQDVSGDPGELAGVDGAWNISSLRISPREQLAFMRKIVLRQLPVSARAYEMTARITAIQTTPDGWAVHGKTGTGSPGRGGHFDASRAYGWFVGWATRGDDSLVFVRLIQDEKATQPNAGLRARDSVLQDLPQYLLHHPRPLPNARPAP